MTSCSAPINIGDSSEICDKACDYKYTYGNSNCVLVNKGNYIQITLDSTNNVLFNDASYSLLEARLYKPSLHTWKGSHAGAELVLVHSGASENLFICIPINNKDGRGYSNGWFAQFMRYVPTNTNAGSSVAGVRNFSLNQAVPQGPYYYYQGAFPFSPCTGGNKNHLVVFDLAYSANMNDTDFGNLSRIAASNQTIYTPPNLKLFFNASGTKNGPTDGKGGSKASTTEVVDCVPVHIDGATGKEIEGAYDIDVSKEASTMSFAKIPSWFWTATAVIGGIILLFALYYVVMNVFPGLEGKLPKKLRRSKFSRSGKTT